MSNNPPLELIADPTRLRVLRELGARDDAGLAELAEAAGVHTNTVRGHVRALIDAGAVERVTATTRRRGRPAVRYRTSEGWRLPGTDLVGLAEFLAAAIVRLGAGERELDELARDWGRQL